MAAGIYFFCFPNHFTFGGVTGLSIILGAVTELSAGTFTLIINMLLLILGFIFLGKGTGIKTVYTSVLLSCSISTFEHFFPLASPLTDEPVLELIFAITVPAAASAIIFNIGASSGGTDIIAMILKKFFSVNIGTALLIVDAIITLTACFVFDIKTGLYSLCGLICKSLVIDSVIENVNLCKYFTIVCKNPEPICNFIHTQLHHSATTFHAEGSYSHSDATVILTVVRRSQAVALRNYVKSIDESAFIMITNSSEIIGKGFRGL